MRVPALVAACLLVVGGGCAHHKADQYAFAPPYAPPVYPQPASGQQPLPAAAAPVVTGVPAPGSPVGAPMMAGGPCDPSIQPVSMQGSPCPPGEYIVPGSMVGGEAPCAPGL